MFTNLKPNYINYCKEGKQSRGSSVVDLRHVKEPQAEIRASEQNLSDFSRSMSEATLMTQDVKKCRKTELPPPLTISLVFSHYEEVYRTQKVCISGPMFIGIFLLFCWVLPPFKIFDICF